MNSSWFYLSLNFVNEAPDVAPDDFFSVCFGILEKFVLGCMNIWYGQTEQHILNNMNIWFEQLHFSLFMFDA